MKGVWDMTQGSLMSLWKQLHFWIALQHQHDLLRTMSLCSRTLH